MCSRRALLAQVLLCVALAIVAVGCNPQAISMMLGALSDNKVQPKYKLFATDKEVKLVILASFADPEYKEDIRPAERELPEQLEIYFRKRCSDNKHKLKIVAQSDIRKYQLNETTGTEYTDPLEIGKHFKADFVLDLRIQSFSLFEPRSYPKLFRGTTEIAINLYKTDVKDGDFKVFTETGFKYEYPGERGPTDAGSTNVANLRALFLNKTAREITKMFIAFDPEERRMMD